MNYKKLGLKVGLEFHQRLDTHKLFCNCSSVMEDSPVIYTVTRRLRPVAGELGELDEAALQEFKRGKVFEYELRKGSSCLVELDEEPPHEVNKDALHIALTISLMLNCNIVDEIHFMRKTVIDGSNTSGFQRTAMVAHGGFLKTPYGRIPIEAIFLEEESAGIVAETEEKKVYRLDRLGIPLVEIATGIIEKEPKEIKDIALRLGRLLRLTGRVQRGIGSIRQDVNISIEKGNRVEIKGLQEVELLDKAIDLEIKRQLSLLEIQKELKRRQLKHGNYIVKDVTAAFEGCENNFIKKALQKGHKVYAMYLPGFEGILGKELTPGRRFGSELADHAKGFGLGGIIHSDEDLGKYKLSDAFNKIKRKGEAVLIVVGEERKALSALQDISNRIKQAFDGVPKETRRFLPDGNSAFMRVLAGAKRMYPETDVPTVKVNSKMLSDIKKQLPEDLDTVLKKLRKMGLSEELAERVVISKRAKLFYKLVDMGVSPTLAASTLEDELISIRREGLDIDNISEKSIEDIFVDYLRGRFSKEAIPKILRSLAKSTDKDVEAVIKNLGIETVPKEKIEEEITRIIREENLNLSDKRKSFRAIMGELMKKYRGRVDGGLMAELVKKKLG